MAVNFRLSKNTAGGAKSCGGAMDSTSQGVVATTSDIDSIFDRVLKHENISGSTEYRCIYVSNDSDSTDSIYSPKIKLISTPDSIIKIAAGSKNTAAESISSESQKPSGMVFKTQEQLNSESGGYLSFTNGTEFAPGEWAPFWIERIVDSASGSGTITEEFVVELYYRG